MKNNQSKIINAEIINAEIINADTSIKLSEQDLEKLIIANNKKIESGLLNKNWFFFLPQKEIIEDLFDKKRMDAPAGTILMLCDFFNIPRFFELSETTEKINILKANNENYKSENKKISDINKEYNQLNEIEKDKINNLDIKNYDYSDLKIILKNNLIRIKKLLNDISKIDVFTNNNFFEKLKFQSKKIIYYYDWLGNAKEIIKKFYREKFLWLNIVDKKCNDIFFNEIETIKNYVFPLENQETYNNTQEKYFDKTIELLNIIRIRYIDIKQKIKETENIKNVSAPEVIQAKPDAQDAAQQGQNAPEVMQTKLNAADAKQKYLKIKRIDENNIKVSNKNIVLSNSKEQQKYLINLLKPLQSGKQKIKLKPALFEEKTDDKKNSHYLNKINRVLFAKEKQINKFCIMEKNTYTHIFIEIVK